MQATIIEPVSPDELQETNARLAAATPRTILEWAVERFFPRLTMATAFGAGGVYPDPPAGRDRAAGAGLQPGHGLSVSRNAGPARPDCRAVRDRGRDDPAGHDGRPNTSSATAGPSTCRIPTSAATIGRSSRCGVPWWDTTRGSRRSGPTSRPTGPRPGRGLGRQVRPGEDQPALELDPARRLGVHRGQPRAV